MFQFRKSDVPIFLARVGHTKLKRVYRVRQKVNSNEGFNLNTPDEKLMCANDKEQQQSAGINSGAKTGGHELEKELSPIVAASNPTDQNTKPKDDVPTSFNGIIRHAIKAIDKSKKMMWIPKGSTLIKVELIIWTSTARPTLKSEPHMASKILLSKHTKKVDP
jgi:hypothetical protein